MDLWNLGRLISRFIGLLTGLISLMPSPRYFCNWNLSRLILFSIGDCMFLTSCSDCRWFAHATEETLAEYYVNFLQWMKTHFAHQVQHIILKTTTSVVRVFPR